MRATSFETCLPGAATVRFSARGHSDVSIVMSIAQPTTLWEDRRLARVGNRVQRPGQARPIHA